jgi:integrase/recombinase XerD
MLIIKAERLFQAYLQKRNYSQRTIGSVLWELGKFIKFLVECGIEEIAGISEKMIEAYFKERYYTINQNGKQNQIVTRNKERSSVKSFLKFLYEFEYITDRLYLKVDFLKGPRLVLPKDILTKQELLKIFRQPDIKTICGYRDRVILEILYATGMRRSELCGLKIQDIRFEERTILIEQGKGQKDRVIPLNETSIKYIQHYLRHIRPELEDKKEPSLYLFLNTKGRGIPSNHLNALINPYLKQAKLKKKVTIHSFRHTVATHLIQEGMPLRHVQEFLGHANLNSTIRYLNLSVKDLQKEYRKYHPREKGT